MIKQKLKSVKGITLTSLAIAVIVLLTITAIIIYNIKDNLKVKNLQQLQSDIENLRDKVSNYYMENGTIPAKSEYSNTKNIETISEAVDTGKFLVLDLSAIENLTLNYGKDYENVKKLSTFQSGQALTSQEMQNNTDLYIINETSHNIFYVKGIDIEGETYYTDYTIDDVDKKAVDLRYIEGIKIPDGYYYVSGTKDTGITIKNSDNTERYKWIVENNEITEVPSDVNLGTNYSWDFIESVNHYKGYYKNTSNNKVMFLETDNWSPIYDKEGIYIDKNGDTASIPKNFYVSTTPGQNTISEGLVAKDTNNNEWVWVEVPKSEMPADLTFANETGYAVEDEVNCAAITKTLKAYAAPYTEGKTGQGYNWTDEWYQECALTSDEYKETYQKMIKSVYKNGGFWIGRYEAGIRGTTGTEQANFNLARTAKENPIDATQVIIQKDAIPYNFVTTSQAETLAKELSPDSSKTSSLLFGIQWDLVCKFLEVRGGVPQANINEDSKTWGNYSNVNLAITSEKAKSYSYNNKIWNKISGEKLSYDNNRDYTLLSTGASETTKKLNIYDFAGNEWEWTLEHATEGSRSL